MAAQEPGHLRRRRPLFADPTQEGDEQKEGGRTL